MAKLYHVAKNYDGGDLLSLYEQFGDEAYDMFAERWTDAGELGVYHVHMVHLFETLAEAQDWSAECGGDVLEIETVDLDITIDKLEKGHPHPVAKRIPAKNVSKVVDKPKQLRLYW